MYYYTGIRGTTGVWILPVNREPVWIVPEIDAAKLAGDVRTFTGPEGPYKKMAAALGGSRIGVEEHVRFAVFDGLGKELPAAEFVSADPVVVGCRVVKSPAELALMQRANDITIEAYRAALATYSPSA